jgi:type II secretory ATPase GspE/PulE/Tfp pilus assembly ATPase PilB-like protein
VDDLQNLQNESGGGNGNLAGAFSDLNQKFKEEEIARNAKTAGLGYADLRKVGMLNPDLLDFLTHEESVSAGVVPFSVIGNKLKIAFVDPQNENLKNLLEKWRARGIETENHLCSPESLQNAQKSFSSTLHREKTEVVAKISHRNLSDFAGEIEIVKTLPEKLVKMKADEALNILHEIALRFKISDFHFEPKKNDFRIRGRVDGILIDFFSLPRKLSEDLMRQIKFNAGLKFNISNIPQEGKYSFQTTESSVNVRVSSIPTSLGESLVMRILDPAQGLLPLEKLGFSKFAFEKFSAQLREKNGLILVTGPTGSGKTTTLQSAISAVNEPGEKVITLEDPVEFQLDGVVQCQVDPEVGFTFAEGLHSLLRQDPDVVLIGEIRDLATTKTAVQAAMTGHLVFSTLHTNSAADAIPRLLNMGVESFMLAPALRAIISQDLVRKICKNCAEKVPANEMQKREIETVLQNLQNRGVEIPEFSGEIFREKGCEKCAGTGFRGRSCVAEVLIPGEQIRKITQKGVRSEEIFHAAVADGMRTEWEEAILKVVQGETSFEEIVRRVQKF